MFPVVVVPGIGFSKIYHANEQTTAWPPQLDPEFFKKEFMGLFFKMALTRKFNAFSDKLCELVRTVLQPFAADETGEPLHENLFSERPDSVAALQEEKKAALLRRLSLQELVQAVGEENVFIFSHVFSQDPMINGDALAAFIESVCEKTGAQKVSLLSIGCGSTVAAAYLAKQQAKQRLQKTVFCFSPLDGTLLLSDLFLDSFDYRKSGSFLCSILSKEDAGMFLELEHMVPGLLESVVSNAFTIIREVFLNLPAAWALCPSDDYEDLAEEFLVDKPQLRARTDAFHALRSSLPQTLQALRQQGTEVEILSGCACPFIPLSKSTDVVSDTLVNTSSSALNPSIAETADPTEYEIKKQSSYFPENTRYFPGVAHTKALKTEAVQKALAEILLK